MKTKTYSVTVQRKDGLWITNFHQYFYLPTIEFSQVMTWCKKNGYIAYGYQYGHNSRNLTSTKTRVVVERLEVHSK